MKRLIFIISLLFFLLTSCAKQKPKGILSEDKMTELMTEVSLIDGYLNTLPIDSGKRVMPVLYDNLFDQYKIDSAVFLQNLHFYLGNPKLTEQIYSKVGVNLNAYENTYRVEDSTRNAFVQDSIKRISKIQMEAAIMRGLIMDFHKDSTDYKYKDNAAKFFNKLELHMNVYGVQTPAIATPQINPAPQNSPMPQVTPSAQPMPVEEVAVPDTSVPKMDTLKTAPLRPSRELTRPKRINNN